MRESAAAAFVNHLLSRNEWARERLSAFSGRRVELRSVAAPSFRFAVLDSGWLAAHAGDDVDLAITIQPGDLPRLLARDPAAIARLAWSGPADFAEALRDVLLHLDWEFEEDLSRVFGDALAHRIVGAGKDCLAWQKDAAWRLAQNFAEYWTEESPLLARPAEAAAFTAGVGALRDDCERIEARVARLEALLRRTGN